MVKIIGKRCLVILGEDDVDGGIDTEIDGTGSIFLRNSNYKNVNDYSIELRFMNVKTLNDFMLMLEDLKNKMQDTQDTYVKIYEDGDTEIEISKQNNKYYMDFHGWSGTGTKEISKQTYEGLIKDFT